MVNINTSVILSPIFILFNVKVDMLGDEGGNGILHQMCVGGGGKGCTDKVISYQAGAGI